MTKSVEIVNCRGFVLRGILNIPENAKEMVVYLHGFTGNRTEHAGHFRNLARRLENKGIASVRFDYHGNGESDGEFSDFRFDDALDDAKRMIQFAKEYEGIEKVDLLGFSLGGAIAGLAVSNEINKLVLWSAAGQMVEDARDAYNNWTKLENGNVYSAGFEMSEAFVTTIEQYDLYKDAGKFDGKCLICQGTKDLAVDPNCSEKYHNVFKNSSIHFVEGAGHGYDRFHEKEELYQATISFLVEE